ncbi:MAG: glycosyltransferase family protein [bacterium]|jgi:spore coat polysaccharide biosynthesis protein SpsF
MHKVIVLQARLGSSRLPGKVLLPLSGRPVLWHILERLKCARTVDQVCVATTVNPADDKLVEFCDEYGVKVIRGSEYDVLQRYIVAAFETEADIVVRATADNPLVHPDGIDEQVEYLENHPECDYVFQSDLPLGTMVETFTRKTLEKLDYVSRDAIYREHVTFYLHDKRGYHGFHMADIAVPAALRNPELRLTLDTEEDYHLLSTIYEELYSEGDIIRLEDVIDYFRRNPGLKNLNKDVVQVPSQFVAEKVV